MTTNQLEYQKNLIDQHYKAHQIAVEKEKNAINSRTADINQRKQDWDEFTWRESREADSHATAWGSLLRGVGTLVGSFAKLL